ncbi:hypothetical protein C9426_22050 [Serratia sp. S1B]|nr:hypothetical protein C9426_22050 [Serratia sp. S1B]
MEIKHEQMRNALRAWAAEVGQRRIAELVTAEYQRRAMTTPRLHLIERADGTIDFDAWHNNKQQIFRWLDSDTSRAKQNIKNLLPAIKAALPPALWASLVAANSIEYRAVQALKQHQAAIEAALLRSPAAVFKRECDKAEREFARFREVIGAQLIH